MALCFDTNGEQRVCTAAELGEQYYDAFQQGQYSGQYDPMYTYYGGILDYMGLEDWEANEGVYSGEWDNLDTNQWLSYWGDYVAGAHPGDLEFGGLTSLGRASRIAEGERELALSTMGRKRESDLYNVGATGLMGSGYHGDVLRDLWSEYEITNEQLALQESQAHHAIYEDMGTSIEESFDALADTTAFDDPGEGMWNTDPGWAENIPSWGVTPWTYGDAWSGQDYYDWQFQGTTASPNTAVFELFSPGEVDPDTGETINAGPVQTFIGNSSLDDCAQGAVDMGFANDVMSGAGFCQGSEITEEVWNTCRPPIQFLPGSTTEWDPDSSWNQGYQTCCANDPGNPGCIY